MQILWFIISKNPGRRKFFGSTNCKRSVTNPEYKKKKLRRDCIGVYGAGDEARTRYLHLGKVALYQMSYTRREHGLL